MSDLSEASILWNIKVRHDHRQFYVGMLAWKRRPTCFFESLDLHRKYFDSRQSVLHVSWYVLGHLRQKIWKCSRSQCTTRVGVQRRVCRVFLTDEKLFLDIFLPLHRLHTAKCSPTKWINAWWSGRRRSNFQTGCFWICTLLMTRVCSLQWWKWWWKNAEYQIDYELSGSGEWGRMIERSHNQCHCLGQPRKKQIDYGTDSRSLTATGIIRKRQDGSQW